MRTLTFVLALTAVSVAAQPPPATEVYLLDLGAPAASRTWINISNNPGYDNQPSFLPDSSAVLFASDRGDGTDIFRYDIGSKVLRQLTHTTEAEYSPSVTPDGKGFSVVRVETDKTQRLWRFDLDGTNPRLVLEDVKPVGYHAWIDATHLALFVLGSPNSLYVADTTTGAAESVHAGIGRSILIRPGAGTVTFTTTGASPMIMEMDPKTRSVKPLRAPLQGSQDTAWSPDGHILYMATGSVIQSVDADRPEGKWAPAFRLGGADSSGTGPALDRITRMAVSRDGRWLAFVAEPRVP